MRQIRFLCSLLPLSQAFAYVWENHRDEADWFLKADDDTFVILENLKDLLRNYNSEKPIQFGHRFKFMGVGHLWSEFIFVTIFPGIHGWGVRICPFKGDRILRSQKKHLYISNILVPGCPSDICNRSEGEEGLFGRRLQMGRRGREDG